MATIDLNYILPKVLQYELKHDSKKTNISAYIPPNLSALFPLIEGLSNSLSDYSRLSDISEIDGTELSSQDIEAISSLIYGQLTAYINENIIDQLNDQEINLAGYASEEFVKQQISNIDLHEYAKLSALDNYARLSDISGEINLEEYAKLSDIPDITLDDVARLSDIPGEINLEEYAKLSDIPGEVDIGSISSLIHNSLTAYINEKIIDQLSDQEINLAGYASEEFVAQQISNLNLSDIINDEKFSEKVLEVIDLCTNIIIGNSEPPSDEEIEAYINNENDHNFLDDLLSNEDEPEVEEIEEEE